MIIIDKTILSPPILEWKPKPLFKTSLAKQKYWEQQKQYWVEGYNGLPGLFYYMVQECWIKHRHGGKTTRVKGRDVDLLLAQRLMKAFNDRRPLGVIKGRGVGLSSFGAVASSYIMKLNPGTNSLITGKDQNQIFGLFRDKIMPVINNLDPDIYPTEISKNETKPYCFLNSAYAYKDEQGNNKYEEGAIHCRETSQTPKSPSNFSGLGAKYGFIDEWPLHKRREELMTSMTECLLDEDKNFNSMLLLGGTCEDTLTNTEIIELQKSISSAGEMDIDLLFIPFWMAFNDANGHADEKRGMEMWEKRVEDFESKGKMDKARGFKMNNPRFMSDIFDLKAGKRFEEDNDDRIKEQHKLIVAANVPLTICKLVELNNEVNTVVDKTGKVTILENPKPGIEYRLEIDGVATGTDVGEEEGSSVAGTIVKGYDPEGGSYGPVCIYKERPETVENSYYVLMNQAKYYNKFGGLKSINPEGNAGNADHICTFLDKQGMGNYISFRKDLSGKGNSNTRKRGTYVTKDVRDWQMKQANIFVRKYIGNIRMLPLLEEMLKPVGENTDIMDSWLMWFVDVGPDFDKPIKKIIIPKRKISIIQRDASGRTYYVDKEINL